MQGVVLHLEHVTRRFGEVVAVEDASVRLEPGAIHAIVGENGAGKSTLLKMAAGVVPASRGRVMIEGAPLDPATAAEAIRRGVGMVHQHFMLVGSFTALENLMLGSEPTLRWGRLDRKRAAERARALMEETGLAVPLEAAVDDLTVGERQRLEIVRVLFRGARAILLDEPTAVLSPLEAEELYATLKKLARDGATVAVVTHRLDEVVRHAAHVTVMRGGRVVGDRALDRGDPSPRALEDELTRAIMGGEPPPAFTRPAIGSDAPRVLVVEGLTLSPARGEPKLADVSFTVSAGEIVGVAGVEGNGQRELVRALAGLEPRARGSITACGVPLVGPPRARRPYLAVVHEDRHAEGLLLDATVADNLVLGDLGDGLGMNEGSLVRRRIHDYGVRPAEPARLAGELSGGNQQKLVIARAVDRLRAAGAGVLVLAQPTRGVDVGAAATIHAAIGESAKAGLAVLVVSADLAELRRLAHRLIVVRRGRIVATLPPDADETTIGRAMLGMEAA